MKGSGAAEFSVAAPVDEAPPTVLPATNDPSLWFAALPPPHDVHAANAHTQQDASRVPAASPDVETLNYLTVLSSFDPDNMTLIQRSFDSAWKLAKAKRHEAGALRAAQDHSAEHERLLEAAILNSRRADNWEALADSALRASLVWLADAASRKAVHLDPRSSPAHAIRAETLFAMQQTGPAMAHMLAAIENSTDEPATATPVIGRCYARCQRVAPGARWDFAELVRVLLARGQRGKAMAAFVRGISLVEGYSQTRPLQRSLFALSAAGAEKPPTSAARTSLPLVLISQIQRSGGTLLAQLFDGHERLLVHPQELQIGHPMKWDWPRLDLAAPPDEWLVALFESVFTKFMVKGYSKSDGNTFALKDRRAFDFSLENLQSTFHALAHGATTQREILDAYLAAFFEAWRSPEAKANPRRYVAFCPRLIIFEKSVAGFFSDYPDGKLITCVRNPVSWFASSVKHTQEYDTLDKALPLWIASTQAALALARARPAQVHVLTYDDLVTDTERVMRRLAKRIGINFDPILLTPTYMREPILPNSSYDINEFGVHRQSLDPRDKLSAATLARIEAEAGPLYREVLDLIGAGSARPADSGAPASKPAAKLKPKTRKTAAAAS